MNFRPIDVIRDFTIHRPIDRLSAVTPHRPRVILRFGLGQENESPGGRGADRAGILKITKTKTAQSAVRSPKEMLFE